MKSKLTFLCLLLFCVPRILSAEQLLNPPAIPETAAILTALEYEKIPPLNRPFVKFIWSPTGSDEQYEAVTAAINFVVNDSSLEYTPPRVAHGKLIMVDLSALANDEKGLQRLLYIWNHWFASREPYFHVHLFLSRKNKDSGSNSKDNSGKDSSSKDSSGKDGATKDGSKDTGIKISDTINLDAPAPYLGAAGSIIEQYNGNTLSPFDPTTKEPNTDYYSYTPVCRADWFVRIVMSSIDGGLYNSFIGVEPGTTKLDDFLNGHGASLKVASDSNSIESFIKGHSDVTGKPRRVRVYAEQGVRLTTNLPIVAITDDPADDSIKFDPLSGERDPNLSLLLLKNVFHEAFVTKPNGWMYFLLSDDKGTLLAEADQKVVSDRLVPPPNATRLQSASCIRCHGSNGLWQPLRSEIINLVHGTLKINTDLSKGDHFDKQFDALRQIRFQYGAEQPDIDLLLMNARLAFDRRSFSTTHKNAVPLLKSLSLIYDLYEYGSPDGAVDALIASREIGFDPITVDPKDPLKPGPDPLGVITFAQVVPPLDPDGIITSGSAGLLNRLTNTYKIVAKHVDPKTDLKIDEEEERGMTLTRREWERAYADAMTRAAPLIHQVLEQPTYKATSPKQEFPKLDKPQPASEKVNP